MIEIIKAGIKLRKRRAGEEIYVRGFMSSTGQFQIREQIATLQDGLDRPGTHIRDVLATINDAGLLISYRWDFTDGWVSDPYFFGFTGLVPGVFISVPQFDTAFDTSFEVPPNILPLWYEKEGRKVEYWLWHSNVGSSLTFDGEHVIRREHLGLINAAFIRVIADDLRATIFPDMTVSVDMVIGTLAFAHQTAFQYKFDVTWSGPDSDYLFATLTGAGGAFPAWGKRDIFR